MNEKLTGEFRYRIQKSLFEGHKLVLQVQEDRTVPVQYSSAMKIETIWRDATLEDLQALKVFPLVHSTSANDVPLLEHKPLEVTDLTAERNKLRDAIEDAHADLTVWVYRPMRCIMDGLDKGINTVPNSLPHNDLKTALPRFERQLNKMEELMKSIPKTK